MRSSLLLAWKLIEIFETTRLHEDRTMKFSKPRSYDVAEQTPCAQFPTHFMFYSDRIRRVSFLKLENCMIESSSSHKIGWRLYGPLDKSAYQATNKRLQYITSDSCFISEDIRVKVRPGNHLNWSMDLSVWFPVIWFLSSDECSGESRCQYHSFSCLKPPVSTCPSATYDTCI